MPSELHALLSQPGSVLLWGNGTWSDDSATLLLHSPDRVLTADEPDQIPPLLDAIDAEIRSGRRVAGYLSYEAGAAFELTSHPPIGSMPLAWFASYQPQNAFCVPVSELRAALIPSSNEAKPRLNITSTDYESAIARIKDLIAAGDTYQVNYTCHARFQLDVDPLDYFLTLVRSHPVPYAAFINLGDTQILSVSPELFLKRRGDLVETRPMKGTRPRGRTTDEDEQLGHELQASDKDRAENVMIVDMMRNDLGRFCRTGSVSVPSMFTVEKYRSLWQMISTVTGLAPGVSIRDIMAATFPASSITGAPKRRTMEIIRDLEPEPRGIYTGAICLFEPGGDFTCSVAIRTLVHRNGEFDLGIGSGIVWDSDPQSEYEETLLKSKFAFDLAPDLRLFETLLLHRDRRYAYESEHIARIAQSADYWDFPFDESDFRARLREFAESAEDLPLRVHAEIGQDGDVTINAIPLPAAPSSPVRVLISTQRTNSADRLLFHKTTERRLYDAALRDAQNHGFFEVLFLNERDNLTEGSFSNLFVRIDGRWISSPISEGLLPGIWRDRFVAQVGAAEQVISISDLARADQFLIGNSVRGPIPVGEITDQASGAILTPSTPSTRSTPPRCP